MSANSANEFRDRVIAALRSVRDPEIPINIYDLGLIYDLVITSEGEVDIRMTLTAPACPVADAMPGEVSRAVGKVAGVRGVSVEIVWDPPWSPERMSEAARLELGLATGIDLNSATERPGHGTDHPGRNR